MSSTTWKWIGLVVLAVIGVLALIVGIIYLAEPIHSLPAFLGGKTPMGKHHYRGNHKRRGEALLVFAVVVLGVTAYLGYRLNRSGKPTEAGPVGSAGSGSAGSTGAGSAGPVATDSSSALSAEPSSGPSPETAAEPQ